MAVHAGLGGGHSGVGSFIYSAVTVVAVHAHVAGVQFVTVGHGLDRTVTGLDVRWRAPVIKSRDPSNGADRQR